MPRLLNLSKTRVKWCGQYLLFCVPHMLHIYFFTNSCLSMVGERFFAYSKGIHVHCSLVNILIERELSLPNGSVMLILKRIIFLVFKYFLFLLPEFNIKITTFSQTRCSLA